MELTGDSLVLNNLKQNKLLEIFCDLAAIPSPSLYEDKVVSWVEDFCKKNDLSYELDDFKNVFIKVKAKNPDKKPILLSAHMDVVGDFSPINLNIDGNFIQTDGKRTLGADDKVGVACALFLALELSQNNPLSPNPLPSHSASLRRQGHSPLSLGGSLCQGERENNYFCNCEYGGLEIALTRDEEHGMSGIKHFDFKKIHSKYVFVLDADKLGQLLVSGASYTNAYLKITTLFGGHSGIDIHEKNRLNAAKLISELIYKIPQGVFFADETGTITSINLGTVIGGNIQNTVNKVISEKVETENYLDYFIKNSITNVINTEAQASYSIRSASVEKENELKQLIEREVAEFNKKYNDLAKAEINFSMHLPPFEKSEDDLIEKLHTNICKELNIKSCISSFHAGAETHIYAQNTNAYGEKFSPFLVGLADVFNMHSNSEKVDYQTILKGYELLKRLFIELT